MDFSKPRYSLHMPIRSIDIVAPVYNQGDGITTFVEVVIREIKELGLSYSIILIDDGSSDNSWNQIRLAVKNNFGVKGVRLQRNFGQHKAILAGLRASNSDIVVVMDSDLQDDPALIPKLVERYLDTNKNIVVSYKEKNGLSIPYRVQQAVFYRILNSLIDFYYDPNISNFGVYSRDLIQVIVGSRTPYPFFPVLVMQAGHPYQTFESTRLTRLSGKSQYTFKKKVSHALSIIFGQSLKVMRLTSLFGLIISFLAFSFSGIILGYRLFLDDSGKSIGWYSLVVVISFFSGIIMMSIGVLGYYLNWVLNLVAEKPLFLVADTEEGLN